MLVQYMILSHIRVKINHVINIKKTGRVLNVEVQIQTYYTNIKIEKRHNE